MSGHFNQKCGMIAHYTKRFLQGKGWNCVPVSVIIPVFNVEEYLQTCLISCIQQTLTDIEIICVDDGSTDRSGEILDDFARKDPRIKVIHKTNGGLSSARNTGMQHAHGDILMFLDSDDFLDTRACQRVWEEMNKTSVDLVIFGGTPYPDFPTAPQWIRKALTTREARYDSFSPKILFHEPGAKPFVWHHGYRRKLLEKYHICFDQNVSFGEDMVFQMELFPHCTHFSFISDKLYHYRWNRSNSLMDTMSRDPIKKRQHHADFVEIITEYWHKQGWLNQYGPDFTCWILEFLIRDFCNMNQGVAKPLIRQVHTLLKKYNLLVYLKEMPNSHTSLVDAVLREQ